MMTDDAPVQRLVHDRGLAVRQNLSRIGRGTMRML